jgi:hypothetical protein
MFMRALFVTGLLVASLTPAVSDTITARIVAWDKATRSLTIDDKSQFKYIPQSVKFPDDLAIGDEVTIEYEGGEVGHDGVQSIVIAKKAAPADKGN